MEEREKASNDPKGMEGEEEQRRRKKKEKKFHCLSLTIG